MDIRLLIRPSLSSLLIAALLLVGVSCRSVVQPDIRKLYDQAAMAYDDHRNPVIVIPGILGSKLALRGTEQVVWGAFAGDYADPGEPNGARLVGLPMRKGVPLSDLTDDVRSTGALDRVEVSLWGLSIEQRAYLQILVTLGIGGYRDDLLGESGAVDYGDDHFTCFQFHYDWRRDLAENAALLKDFIAEKRSYIEDEQRRRFGKVREGLKFDIVAHSMGGLVSRYYLRYGDQDLPADGSLPKLDWAGADEVDRLILVGTPNGGSAEAILQLVEGFKPGPFLPTYSPAVLGTMPAIYQLLPRERHRPVVAREAAKGSEAVRYLDPKFWIDNQWGLANPEQGSEIAELLPDVSDPVQRREIALDHLTKCLTRAEQFHRALDVPAQPPRSTMISIFAGDALDTAAVVSPRGAGHVEVVERDAGDGTVLRTSALMDERLGNEWKPGLRSPIAWSRVQLMFSGHIELTQDPSFTDNVLFLLLEAPRVGTFDPM